ncbi:MAG: response regulator [Candidatus Levybacteria bacterium]|nr:response regulator [Candidatus Levybacteria bacterium]MBP9815116.1 response regulator [Candidatus Levybacteria bacterium]
MKKEIVSKKIFVVDDDVFIGDILKIMLESENYKVFPFTTGKSALQFFFKKHPDLVILDYFIMGEDFTQIMQGFKRIGGESLPIILMSANKVSMDIVKKNKISEFIEKPFQRDVILAVVARNLN